MTIRAKFTFNGFESTLSSMPTGEKDEGGRPKYAPAEMRTLKFAPVYANGDPNHENSKFWAASPSGEIRLGTVNPEAWRQFELGKEYYVDFTPAGA